MSRFGIILAMAAVTYAIRASGLLAHRWQPAGAIERFLAYVPVAVFAALTAPALTPTTGDWTARLAGASLATLAVLRTRQLWAGLAAGMGAYWAVRAVT